MLTKRIEKKGLILPWGQELTPASYLLSMPVHSPKKIYERLAELGYKGQERARRAVCVCAYRHIKRLRDIYLEHAVRRDLPRRSNALLIGPTGCGKSYIIELLFREILRLPYTIVEMTRFSETGYVGDDVVNIINSLIDDAHGRIDLAQCGIVALDEFDKIAAKGSLQRFAGGSFKDVSGYGVQRELLKMVEGADVVIPREYMFTHYGARDQVSTRDITFFALGAFTGFNKGEAALKKVGFNRIDSETYEQQIAYDLNNADANDIMKFQEYGFLPELIARFDRIIPFEPLDRNSLGQILTDKIRHCVLEFKNEGFDLLIDDAVHSFIYY